MRRARVILTPELLAEFFGLPGLRLVGPTNIDGNMELTIEHESLDDVPVAEGAKVPVVALAKVG